MNPETKAILDSLLESRQILEAKLQSVDSKLEAMDSRLEAMDSRLEAMDSKLEAVSADVAAIKEQLADMNAKDQYLTQKTGELEAELFVVKRRQKA